MKNILKNIAYNCKEATLLIEKKQGVSLTIREKLELKVHLAGCSACRMFEQQSILINKLVYDLFHQSKLNDFKLDDEFKKQMQDRIEEKLDKN
ncbi:zf-HC2 domain-containing protein [uncultured Mucilaginibacter sp.]|uniref:zf-HC2 domain-containing protein n=1 Tax=uncultured Mucilaginibacter sp. TaxID=797541 RepID=UPI0025D2F92D|nr:zf-HC2 domain-containing protein [uncultured Mucilaginibacter sp.]